MYEKLQELRARRAEREAGFTLIELLVVVVIIGILIAIAIPLYLNYQKGAHDKSAQSDLRSAVSTLQQCYTDNGNSYPATANSGSGTEGADLVFYCPDANSQETANVSSGTTLTYTALKADGTACSTAPCAAYKLESWNSGGHHSSSANEYVYNSTTGGTIQ